MVEALSVVDDIVLLRTKGFTYEQIQDFTLYQYVWTMKSLRRMEIRQRKAFISDLTASISGVLGGDTLGQHINDIDLAELRET